MPEGADALPRGRAPRFRRRTSTLVAVALAGVVVRLALVAAAPRFGYAWDHFDVIGMGVVAEARGLTRVYSATESELPVLRGHAVQDGRDTVTQRRCAHLPNYPPLCELVFWLQSRWLGASDPGFVANTVATRMATSVVPWLFELLTAVGAALLARALTGSADAAWTAGAVTWLAPPVLMNTALFSQYDALVLAPALFALVAMLHGRWIAAGVALGCGLLLKPQGLLMAPVAAFAAAVGAPSDPDRAVGAGVRRAVAMSGAALVTVAVGSAPWMLADGLAWIERCYRRNLFEVMPYTTLEAFNVWYLRALIAERTPTFDVLVSTVPVAGLTRDAWGRLFLAAALAGTAALCWRRVRTRPAAAVVLFAGLALWATFVWPTRVHERYLLYCVPVMIVAAIPVPRLRPAVAALVLVATMEHGWMVWRGGPSVGSFDRRAAEQFHDERFRAYWQGKAVTVDTARAAPKLEESIALAFERHRAARRGSLWLEWLLTVVSLGAYAAALAVVATTPSDRPPPSGG